MTHRYRYEKDEISIVGSQCEICKLNDENSPRICEKYPNGKPSKIIMNETVCPYFFEVNSFKEDEEMKPK